jgi:hypothetical protein
MDTNSKKQQEIIHALRSENERLKREVDYLKSVIQRLQEEDYPGDAQISFEDYIQVVRDCKWRCEESLGAARRIQRNKTLLHFKYTLTPVYTRQHADNRYVLDPHSCTTAGQWHMVPTAAPRMRGAAGWLAHFQCCTLSSAVRVRGYLEGRW